MKTNIRYKRACLRKAALIAALLTVALAITLLSQDLSGGVESRHAALPCKHGDVEKDGLMPSAHKLVQPNNSSESRASPAQNFLSPADIYARLCENASIAPWQPPTPIPSPSPNFAKSILEIRTTNHAN